MARKKRSGQADEKRWDAVYRARQEFFEQHLGPLPNDIQKLLNLTGVWPGGGLFQFEATQFGGLGVCATFGLTNSDMPARVTLQSSKVTAEGGQTTVETVLQAREPRKRRPSVAGYGYEVMVLTPSPDPWPLLALGWVVQMEILNDIDLLGRVEECGGVTVEEVKIGDGRQTANFLIEPACGPTPARTRLPNGTMHLLVATRITRDEMEWSRRHGRPALMERLIEAGVGSVSLLDRPSVLGRAKLNPERYQQGELFDG